MVRVSHLWGHVVDDQTAIDHGPTALGPMWVSKDFIKISMTTSSGCNYGVLKGG